MLNVRIMAWIVPLSGSADPLETVALTGRVNETRINFGSKRQLWRALDANGQLIDSVRQHRGMRPRPHSSQTTTRAWRADGRIIPDALQIVESAVVRAPRPSPGRALRQQWPEKGATGAEGIKGAKSDPMIICSAERPKDRTTGFWPLKEWLHDEDPPPGDCRRNL